MNPIEPESIRPFWPDLLSLAARPDGSNNYRVGRVDPEIFSRLRVSNGLFNGCAVGGLLWFTDGARVTKMSFSGSFLGIAMVGFGSPDCIGTPIDLDEVCALEGDDD